MLEYLYFMIGVGAAIQSFEESKTSGNVERLFLNMLVIVLWPLPLGAAIAAWANSQLAAAGEAKLPVLEEKKQ